VEQGVHGVRLWQTQQTLGNLVNPGSKSQSCWELPCCKPSAVCNNKPHNA
jgi:hypothetical protein